MEEKPHRRPKIKRKREKNGWPAPGVKQLLKKSVEEKQGCIMRDDAPQPHLGGGERKQGCCLGRKKGEGQG